MSESLTLLAFVLFSDEDAVDDDDELADVFAAPFMGLPSFVADISYAAVILLGTAAMVYSFFVLKCSDVVPFRLAGRGAHTEAALLIWIGGGHKH